jgi:hypothetical protein
MDETTDGVRYPLGATTRKSAAGAEPGFPPTAPRQFSPMAQLPGHGRCPSRPKDPSQIILRRRSTDRR